MIIAISSDGKNLTSNIDGRFGRAKYFIIYDIDKLDYQCVENSQNMEAAQGAGIQSAKNIINSGARAVITGNVGPKAFSTLSSAQIEVYLCTDGTVHDAVDKFRKGLLVKSSNANVEGHW